MASPSTDPTAAPSRRQARDITEAVVANMRKNLERLRYSTLAPSRYTVYLHPREYERLEGIVPILQEHTVRALTEELERLNGRSSIRKVALETGKVLQKRDVSAEHFGEGITVWKNDLYLLAPLLFRDK